MGKIGVRMDMEMTPPCPGNVTVTVMRYRGVAREKLCRLGALLKSSLERFSASNQVF